MAEALRVRGFLSALGVGIICATNLGLPPLTVQSLNGGMIMRKSNTRGDRPSSAMLNLIGVVALNRRTQLVVRNTSDCISGVLPLSYERQNELSNQSGAGAWLMPKP